MADYAQRVLLAVFIVLATVPTLVDTNTEENTCSYMDECNKQMTDQAREIGHDRDQYCQLLAVEILCYQRVISLCKNDLQAVAQNQLQRATEDQNQQCGALTLLSSKLTICFAVLITILLHFSAG